MNRLFQFLDDDVLDAVSAAGVVAATRVRAGEESDRAPSRDLVERAARIAETGSAGLPVGVQVVARHWREDVALAVMGALEEHVRTQPEHPARPPICSTPPG